MKEFRRMMLPAVLFSAVSAQTSANLVSACNNMVDQISGAGGCMGDTSGDVRKSYNRALPPNGFVPHSTMLLPGMRRQKQGAKMLQSFSF
jgi:hypothetical protein